MVENVVATYAAYSKNEDIRLKSSSGAVFSVFADKIFEQQGVIYGVAMSADCKIAEYIRVNSKDEMYRLRGSKYLQAQMGRIFIQVQKDLQKGIQVLFTGTGCQVNGLKSYLGRDYENLYCLDVICHGVPSPLLWRKYVDNVEKRNNARLININFRCKDDSWVDFGMKEIDSNHKEVYISKDEDAYMQMFLRDYCLRPSCYACKVKEQKMSDVTIGDFWGIENVVPEMNDGKGISLVLIRTEAGKQLFEQIQQNLYIQEVNYEDAIKRNPAEYFSVTKPKERETFFKDMNKVEFEELEKKYASPIKISVKGIIKKKVKNILMKTPIRYIFKGDIMKSGDKEYD